MLCRSVEHIAAVDVDGCNAAVGVVVAGGVDAVGVAQGRRLHLRNGVAAGLGSWVNGRSGR